MRTFTAPRPSAARLRPVLALALASCVSAAGAQAAGGGDPAPGAAAGEAPARPARPAQPLWEAGLLATHVEQAAYPGARSRVGRTLAIPFFIYRGEWLRADRDNVGLRALRTERTELDIGFSGSFGTRGEDVPEREGLPALGTLLEFGPKLNVQLGRLAGGRLKLELPVRGVFDASDSLRHRGMAFEPELGLAWGGAGGFTGLSLGAVFADARLAHTLYGIDAADARADRPAWQGRAGLVAWRAGVSHAIPLGPDWRLFGALRGDWVSGAANVDSPLVVKRSSASAVIGVTWTLGRSEARER